MQQLLKHQSIIFQYAYLVGSKFDINPSILWQKQIDNTFGVRDIAPHRQEIKETQWVDRPKKNTVYLLHRNTLFWRFQQQNNSVPQVTTEAIYTDRLWANFLQGFTKESIKIKAENANIISGLGN